MNDQHFAEMIKARLEKNCHEFIEIEMVSRLWLKKFQRCKGAALFPLLIHCLTFTLARLILVFSVIVITRFGMSEGDRKKLKKEAMWIGSRDVSQNVVKSKLDGVGETSRCRIM